MVGYRHITLRWREESRDYEPSYKEDSLLQWSSMSIEKGGIRSRTPAECYVYNPANPKIL